MTDTEKYLRDVSIQPKPKKGLEEARFEAHEYPLSCFNPAEAEEGFRRKLRIAIRLSSKRVSIQPKPKKGLEEESTNMRAG